MFLSLNLNNTLKRCILLYYTTDVHRFCVINRGLPVSLRPRRFSDDLPKLLGQSWSLRLSLSYPTHLLGIQRLMWLLILPQVRELLDSSWSFNLSGKKRYLSITGKLFIVSFTKVIKFSPPDLPLKYTVR